MSLPPRETELGAMDWMLNWYVNMTLLFMFSAFPSPSTFTITGKVPVSPSPTLHTMWVSLDELVTQATPPIMTRLRVWLPWKPVPVIVISVDVGKPEKKFDY